MRFIVEDVQHNNGIDDIDSCYQQWYGWMHSNLTLNGETQIPMKCQRLIKKLDPVGGHRWSPCLIAKERKLLAEKAMLMKRCCMIIINQVLTVTCCSSKLKIWNDMNQSCCTVNCIYFSLCCVSHHNRFFVHVFGFFFAWLCLPLVFLIS